MARISNPYNLARAWSKRYDSVAFVVVRSNGKGLAILYNFRDQRAFASDFNLPCESRDYVAVAAIFDSGRFLEPTQENIDYFSRQLSFSV